MIHSYRRNYRMGPVPSNFGDFATIFVFSSLGTIITPHHIEETDAGLDRPLYLRNNLYDKTLKSLKLLL